MRLRKKSRSELLNEEMLAVSDQVSEQHPDENPHIEDFDADRDVQFAALPSRHRRAQLRRRGPLDESLSSGKYSAVPRGSIADDFDEEVDEAAIEGGLDDLFGMLDEEEADNADVGDESDYDKQLQKKLEARAQKRQRSTLKGKSVATFKGLDPDDADVMRQIEQLRSTQQLHVVDEPAAGTDITAQENELAREMVSTFSQLLAFRIKLQSCIVKAIQLPQHYALPHFSDHSAAVASTLKTTRQDLRQMMKNILIAGGASEPIGRATDQLWEKLARLHSGVMGVVHRGIERWGHHAFIAADPKLNAVNRPLLEQIQGVISGRQRLLHRAQRNRAHLHIYGHPHHYNKCVADRALAIAEGDEDNNVFDDGDFVKELAQQQGGLTAALGLSLAENVLSDSLSKRGHHRTTKGRAVNYHPHPKIVGFLASVPFEDNPRHTALIKSLFGGPVG